MSAAPQPLPSAIEKFDSVMEKAARQRLFLFLDFDGTLAPIVLVPEEAALEEGMIDVLRPLARRIDMAIVSGRGLDDVRNRVAIEGISYAGSHGFEIRDPDGRLVEHEEAKGFLPALDHAERALNERLGGIEGAIIDRKRFAIAVHYRLTPPNLVPHIEPVLDEILRECPGIAKSGGKMVFELRPNLDWNKGRAVEWLAHELCGGETVFPIFIGDDLTDEDGFRAVLGWGVGIFVGAEDRETNAHYVLRNPKEVRSFLDQLLGYVERQAA